MSDHDLFFALLRVSALQILRTAGLTTAKPSVIDAFTDILARYLLLLGTTTRDYAESAGRLEADLVDVRHALEHVGLVRPMNIYDDSRDEDTRGIEGLVEWFRGPQAREMRRVAGFAKEQLDGAPKNEDWNRVVEKIREKRAQQQAHGQGTQVVVVAGANALASGLPAQVAERAEKATAGAVKVER